jgi:hypothetical protein
MTDDDEDDLLRIITTYIEVSIEPVQFYLYEMYSRRRREDIIAITKLSFYK